MGHLRLIHNSEEVYFLAIVRPVDEQHYFLRYLREEAMPEDAQKVFDVLGSLVSLEDILQWQNFYTSVMSERMHVVCYRT